jgi:hypothetical protein
MGAPTGRSPVLMCRLGAWRAAVVNRGHRQIVRGGDGAIGVGGKRGLRSTHPGPAHRKVARNRSDSDTPGGLEVRTDPDTIATR